MPEAPRYWKYTYDSMLQSNYRIWFWLRWSFGVCPLKMRPFDVRPLKCVHLMCVHLKCVNLMCVHWSASIWSASIWSVSMWSASIWSASIYTYTVSSFVPKVDELNVNLIHLKIWMNFHFTIYLDTNKIMIKIINVRLSILQSYILPTYLPSCGNYSTMPSIKVSSILGQYFTLFNQSAFIQSIYFYSIIICNQLPLFNQSVPHKLLILLWIR